MRAAMTLSSRLRLSHINDSMAAGRINAQQTLTCSRFDGAFDDVAGLLQIQNLLPILRHQFWPLRSALYTASRMVASHCSPAEGFSGLHSPVACCLTGQPCSAYCRQIAMQQAVTSCTLRVHTDSHNPSIRTADEVQLFCRRCHTPQEETSVCSHWSISPEGLAARPPLPWLPLL